jgi:hypothetical protein
MAADLASRDAVRHRRACAAARYKPDVVDLLLVAGAPPADSGRYFYFEDVGAHDSLFRYVARGILNQQPDRATKAEVLSKLRERRVFLIDLCPDPVEGTPLAGHVPDLVRRARRLSPRRIIVIKAPVYDLVHEPLREAGLPVVSERIPFRDRVSSGALRRPSPEP